MMSLVYELPPGAVIGGRYKLLKSLGQGGFGITYIAWDKELGRNVAVKECFPAGVCMREPEGGAVRPIRSEWEPMYLRALDDMRAEAHTLAGLNHDSIVHVHDIIWGNGSVFCVMPWLSSGTLKDRLEKDPPDAEESLQWLRRLLDALGYLHERGVIHRDLKPDNIMFNEAGNPVIIDFGAALNRPEQTTSTTQGSFSRGYAAPEQITGKGAVGPWTDFYALSATWYELLTGIHPEAADARLMVDDLVPLTEAECRVAYPVELLALLQRNLSLRPAERCSSVAQWMQCWKSGTLPPLPIPRYGRLKRRSFVAAGLVALAAGAAYSAYRFAPAERTVAGAAATATPEAVRAQMTSRLDKLCRTKEYAAFCADYMRRLEEVRTGYDKRRRDLIASIEEAIPRYRSERAASLDVGLYSARYTDLAVEQDGRCEALLTEFLEKGRAYPHRVTDIIASFPVKNVEESALLPVMAAEVEQKASALSSKVTEAATSYARVSSNDTDKAFNEAIDKLISRAAELDRMELDSM